MPRAKEHEWRCIPGHPDYAISSAGTIASYKRHPHRPRFLKPTHDAYGYAVVTLDNTRYYLHRLLAAVFLDAPPGAVVRFNSANRYDTRISNLRWVLPGASTSAD